MSRPFKHPDTHVYYFRKAVPADLRPILGKVEVKRSLGTKSAAEARLKFAEVEAEVAAEWKRLRAEPSGLSKRDALALAGRWYVWFVGQHEDEPGDGDGWALLGEQLDDFDQQASGLLDERTVEGAYYVRSPATEARIRAFLTEHGRIEAFLRTAGVHLTLAGKAAFYNALRPQFTAAMRQLAIRSSGDYSPDDHLATLPEWRPSKPPTQVVSLNGLFDRWAAETKPREKTIYSWRRVVGQLVTHLHHDDAAKVTKADIVAWKDAMVAADLASKTIRDSKLAPVLAVLRWSVANSLLPSNPAEGVGVTVRAEGRKPRGYHDHEARRVLEAALRESAPYLRWLPLLCAMTGARLSELCQLRVQDVQQEGEVRFLHLTWDAGNLKNQSSERRVPLHSALIARGFLTFVKERRDGPLFQELPPDRFGNRGGNATKRIGAWVKSRVGLDDERISPSHSWRHRFKTLCRRYGIGADFHDALTGHAKANEGAAYGEFPLDALARELEKLPDPLG